MGNVGSLVGYIPALSETSPVATFGRISIVGNVVPGDYLTGHTYAPVGEMMRGGAVFNRWGDLVGIILESITYERRSQRANPRNRQDLPYLI